MTYFTPMTALTYLTYMTPLTSMTALTYLTLPLVSVNCINGHQVPDSSPKDFLFTTNVVVVFFFLFSCLAPYLNPQNWWFISFFGSCLSFFAVADRYFVIAGWLIILKPRLCTDHQGLLYY